jgi:Flp pilus assembly protein TadG
MAGSGRDHTIRIQRNGNDSGQALVEFAISVTLMLIMVFGLIDFSRAIFITEVITNLTGEGSSMASRGTTLPSAASAVVTASTLSFAINGKVIVSSVFNTGSKVQLTAQASQGGLSANSRIGSTIGGTVVLPSTVSPQTNQTVYVTEVFYKYTPITPIGNVLVGVVLPSQLYDVAYY